MRKLAAALAGLMLIGCGVNEAAVDGTNVDEFGTDDSAILATNARPYNARPVNARPVNARPYNGRPYNGRPYNGYAWNMTVVVGVTSTQIGGTVRDTDFDTWFNANPTGADVAMKYVFRCAAPAGTTVKYTSTVGTTYSWPGMLGIVPRWVSTDINLVTATAAAIKTEEEKISSCMLGLTNSLVTPVEIGARGMGMAITANEDLIFPDNEGAFFGNLFVDPPIAYSCREGNRMTNCEVNSALHSCNPATGRTCASNPPSCAMVGAGACSAVCVAGTSRSWNSCTYGGRSWPSIFATKVKPYCGDGWCDSGETTTNCLMDCRDFTGGGKK